MKYYSKLKHFHSRKYIWICRLQNGGHFVASAPWSSDLTLAIGHFCSSKHHQLLSLTPTNPQGSANERQHYNITLSLIGWTHTQNDPWIPGWLTPKRLITYPLNGQESDIIIAPWWLLIWGLLIESWVTCQEWREINHGTDINFIKHGIKLWHYSSRPPFSNTD